MSKKEVTKRYDITGDIIAYENGELNDEQVIGLFQYLVDSGLAWTLQGHYGRMAKALIEAGYVTPKSKEYYVTYGVKKKITGNPLMDGFISP
jgi:hypothetical protein